MLKFVPSIKKKYSERLLHREEQWPPVRGDKLINLQLVEADKTEGFRAGLPQHGARGYSEKIKRTPILLGDLFKSEDGKKPVRKLLVEGNGGMGKTTLCTMLAEGWAEGKMLTQFDCVILLPLREKSISSATTLPQLFKLLHSSERIRMSAVEELEDNEGDRVLIIADGWDELDDINRSPDSFLYNLLFGGILPFASVLLTSRPSASAPLHDLPSVDRFIEVVGFNEENIKQYVKSEFGKFPEKASSLIEQLEHNPLIENVCSVPLNCAILCNLWHTLDQVLPSTLTALYTKIVLNVIYRDIKKKLPKFQIGRSLDSFDSIPEQLQKMFWLTCKFAYECLLRDQIVFSERELASFFPEGLDPNDKLLCFGLLQSAQSLLPVGHGLSFHFLHLTFQEFLAALHLVTQPAGEQLKACKAHGGNFRFAMVWRFAFGLGSKKQRSSVSSNIVHFNDSVENHLVYKVSNSLLLSHCAFESKDDSFVIKVAEVIDGEYCCTTLHDYSAMCHVLRHTSHCPCVGINLSSCELSDKHLTELTDILSSTELELNVKGLDLSENKLTDKGVNDLLLRASNSFSSLALLYLQNNNICDVITSFMHVSCKSLSELSLSDNPLGVSGIQSLERAVQAGVLDNLEELYLSNTLTNDADVNGALLAILSSSIASHCLHLRCFHLARNNLGVPGACALSQSFPLLTSNTKSFHLSLIKTNLNSKAVTAFSTNTVGELSPLASSFSSTPSCRCTLYLDSNPLGYEGLLAIFRMLRSQSYHIVRLSLKNTDLTTSASMNLPIQHIDQDFVRELGLIENSSLESLSLDFNNFCGNRILVLEEWIRVCQNTLKYLYTKSCSLTSVDVIKLISSLKSSGSIPKNLADWCFFNNSIDGEGIAVLVEHLATLFPSLEYINFRNNQLSGKDAQIVRKLEEGLRLNREARQELEARQRARRSAIVTMWERTSLPPQSEELLQEFNEMWDELLEDMVDLAEEFLSEDKLTDSDYSEESFIYNAFKIELPDDQQSTLEVVRSPPPTPSDDESFHSATEELDEPAGHYPTPTTTDKTTCPTVQSPHSTDQQETYKGSQELTLHALTVELEQLSRPIKFGILLKVPQSQLEIIQQNHHLDIDGQKIALFQYIAKNYKSLGITWTSIADALRDIHAGNLSLSIREKYCSTGHGGSD